MRKEGGKERKREEEGGRKGEKEEGGRRGEKKRRKEREKRRGREGEEGEGSCKLTFLILVKLTRSSSTWVGRASATPDSSFSIMPR